MKERKFDIIQLVMQPYVLTLLKDLGKPKRFGDLVKLFRSRRTLTIKLSKLKENGLIEDYPLRTEKGFANSYIITKKGKEIVKKLEKI